MRKKIIAGNWKMNVKPSETSTLVSEVAEATKLFTNVEVVCCTPAIDIPAAVAAAAGTHVGVGAENAHWEAKGAFTPVQSMSSSDTASVASISAKPTRPSTSVPAQ